MTAYKSYYRPGIWISEIVTVVNKCQARRRVNNHIVNFMVFKLLCWFPVSIHWFLSFVTHFHPWCFHYLTSVTSYNPASFCIYISRSLIFILCFKQFCIKSFWTVCDVTLSLSLYLSQYTFMCVRARVYVCVCDEFSVHAIAGLHLVTLGNTAAKLYHYLILCLMCLQIDIFSSSYV